MYYFLLFLGMMDLRFGNETTSFIWVVICLVLVVGLNYLMQRFSFELFENAIAFHIAYLKVCGHIVGTFNIHKLKIYGWWVGSRIVSCA